MSLESTGTEIDYLSEDDLPENSHTHICYSFMSPEGVRNCTMRAIKTRGTFKSLEDAKAACPAIQAKHPNHHIYVGPVGMWNPWDPDPNSCKDQVYAEKEMQELSKAYNENQEKGKLMEKQRQRELMETTIKDSKKTAVSKKDQIVDRLKNKLNNNKLQKEIDDNRPKPGQCDELKEEVKPKELTTEEVEAKKQGEKLTANNDKLVAAESGLKTMDSKISRIKELYAKMQK